MHPVGLPPHGELGKGENDIVKINMEGEGRKRGMKRRKGRREKVILKMRGGGVQLKDGEGKGNRG